MISCAICGKQFHVKPSRVSTRFCCSKKCQNERALTLFNGGKNPNYKNASHKTFNCIVCRQDFTYKTYSNKGKRTCSKKCYLLNLSIIHKGKINSKTAIDKAKITHRITLLRKGCKLREVTTKCICGNKKDQKAKICHKCWRKSVSNKKPCFVCGIEFKPVTSRIKTCSRSCLSKLYSSKRIGVGNPKWKGGVKPEHQRIRQHLSYLNWRKSVYKRDNYTCQDCGKTNCYLHAHHIKSFSDYPELRTDINNGKTLCVQCHSKYHPNMNVKKYKPQNILNR